jgi:hypothetical protein
LMPTVVEVVDAGAVGTAVVSFGAVTTGRIGSKGRVVLVGSVADTKTLLGVDTCEAGGVAACTAKALTAVTAAAPAAT